MAERRPVLARDDRHQFAFDFDRVRFLRQSHAPRQPPDVRIDGNTGRVEAIAEYDVRRLPTNTRQLNEFRERAGHFAVELRHDCLTRKLDVFRFGAKEAGRCDVLFDVFAIGFGKRLRGRELREQSGGDLVDSRIGALRGQDCRDEELEGTGVVQGGERAGVEFRERPQQSSDGDGGSRFPNISLHAGMLTLAAAFVKLFSRGPLAPRADSFWIPRIESAREASGLRRK